MSQTQYSNEIHQPTPNDDGEIERAYSAWDQKFGARQISLGRDNADPFSTGRRLGSGGIGVVYETRLGSIPLAIKRTYARKLTRDQLNEIKILSKLSKQRHHHVVQLIGSYTQRQRAGYELSLVIWPVAHCDLSALLNDFGTLVDWNSRDVTRPILDDNAATDLLSSVEILSHLVDLKMPQNSREVSWLVEKTKHRLLECFGCIANAVAYLHLHGIRHKDLKPSQILLSPNGLWLADFGWSSDMSEFSQSVTSGGDRITMKYRAPERAGMEPCGRSEDVFAIGCIFLEISAYTTSYPTIQASDRPWAQEGWFFQANLEQIYSILKNRLRTSSFTYECAFSRLLGQMLAKDPQERPKTQAILDTLCQPPFKYFFGTEPTNSHVGRCCQTETQAIVTSKYL
jgi:serine/threonine protein kinase